VKKKKKLVPLHRWEKQQQNIARHRRSAIIITANYHYPPS
jgi:hypothetical protein